MEGQLYSFLPPDARWRWWVDLTHPPLYPRQIALVQYLLYWRLGGPKGQSGWAWRRENLLPQPGFLYSIIYKVRENVNYNLFVDRKCSAVR